MALAVDQQVKNPNIKPNLKSINNEINKKIKLMNNNMRSTNKISQFQSTEIQLFKINKDYIRL